MRSFARSGDARSRAEAVLRHADSPRALPGVPRCRRDCPYALDLGDVVGSGEPPDALSRHDARRLFQRPGAVYPCASDDRVRRRVRAADRRSDRRGSRRLDPGVPAVLVASHGAFAWGPSARGRRARGGARGVARVAFNAVVLEASPRAGLPRATRAPLPPQARPDAYYGQPMSRVAIVTGGGTGIGAAWQAVRAADSTSSSSGGVRAARGRTRRDRRPGARNRSRRRRSGRPRESSRRRSARSVGST